MPKGGDEPARAMRVPSPALNQTMSSPPPDQETPLAPAYDKVHAAQPILEFLARILLPTGRRVSVPDNAGTVARRHQHIAVVALARD